MRTTLVLLGALATLGVGVALTLTPAATSSTSTSTATGSQPESAAVRCEWEPITPAELQAMQSTQPGTSSSESAARERCIAHEAFTYELEIDSTITTAGPLLAGRSETKGRIPLNWVFGSRPLEGHWEGAGFLRSTTTPTSAAVCPVSSVTGAGAYDWEVPWVQVSLIDASTTEVWVDAGEIPEEPDTVHAPACHGGGTTTMNFWENHFFLSHLSDRGAHGLQIRGWKGLPVDASTGGWLATAVTPESCGGRCGGRTTFNLHVTPKP